MIDRCYGDTAYYHPVLFNIRWHVHNVYAGELLDETTLNKIKWYLEQTVPGSIWEVGLLDYDLTLKVHFDNEKDLTMYMLRWS